MINSSEFIAVNVYSFSKEYERKMQGDDKTLKLVDNVKLYSGFSNGIPTYRLSSKTIPITGEFTGFPVNTMISWFKSIGYEYIGITSLNNSFNKFKQA